MNRKPKSTPQSGSWSIDSLGKFQKSRTSTNRVGGVKTRGPVKGGK